MFGFRFFGLDSLLLLLELVRSTPENYVVLGVDLHHRCKTGQ
jgi:hypothetical protein